MKHLSEQELIALYYGEAVDDGDAHHHLESCRECTTVYAELKQVLERIQPLAEEQSDAEFGEQVWQRLWPSLTPYAQPEQRVRHAWMRWGTWGLVGACALLLALAFLGGRFWERRMANTQKVVANANPQSAQRVVLVVLTDHLDRTERLLVALDHVNPGDAIEKTELQSQARELLASNRLYRTSASQAGDAALANELDQLERVLAEVANDSNLSAADLERVRKEMNTQGILFEIRVLMSKTPDRAAVAEHPKGAMI